MTRPEIEQEIEQTRERLGRTVEELAAKADLKARGRAKAVELYQQVRRSELARYRWPAALAAGGLVLAGSALVWRQRTT
jgi:predicted RNase H-like nuclease (RuvC/YqgF family)